MALYELQVKGIDPAATMLEDAGDRATHAEAVMEQVVDTLIEGEQTLWRRNGGGGKKKWPPNTKSTLASKIAKSLDPRPMRATGKLERSLTVKGAPGMIKDTYSDKVVFGTSIFYAQFSQLAKDDKRKRIVLDLSAKTKKTVREQILKFLVHGD